MYTIQAPKDAVDSSAGTAKVRKEYSALKITVSGADEAVLAFVDHFEVGRA